MQTFRGEARRVLEARPDTRWLTVSGRQFTFADLHARINDYSAFYDSVGAREGDTILIVLTESLDLFAAFFAAIIHGALPAFYAYPSPKQSVEAFEESVRHLLRFNTVRTVITFPEIAEVLRSHAGTSQPFKLVSFDAVPAARDHSIWNRPVPAAEAFLQFSSGTTGAKKGVRISATALFNQIAAYAPVAGLNSESVIVSWLPHYHDMGLIACMLMPFLLGVRLVMLSPFEWVKNPRLLLEAIDEHRGTHVWLPNFALGHLTKNVKDVELERYDLGSVKRIVLCSELVQAPMVDSFIAKFSGTGLRGAHVSNCYAMAENTFAITSTRGDAISYTDRVGRRIASAGTPLSNASIIVHNDRKQPAADGEIGEVLIKTNCMLERYHNNPGATSQSFRDGWYKTGDLGFIERGELYLTGRREDMIIVGGENFYPEDIEALLNAEPGLVAGRNVAFGVVDERVGTERIVVLAEKKEGMLPDENQIRIKCTNALNVAIGEFRFLPHMTLRKGTAGKISRHLNKQEYLRGAFDQAPSLARGQSQQVRDIVMAVIPAPLQVDLTNETPLLVSGLIDSFGFVDLVQRLEAAYGLDIPQRMLSVANFQTIQQINRTFRALQGQAGSDTPSTIESIDYEAERSASYSRLKEQISEPVKPGPFVERWINAFPIPGSFWFRLWFRLAGIQIGHNVQFLGRVRVKLRGNPANIVIGDNVVLGDGVDLRIRENGKIHLRDGVYLDRDVRIVAARDGQVVIGLGTDIGVGTVINSGGNTSIGSFCMLAGGVNINSSRHGSDRASYTKEQPHSHGFVDIGDDVWVGSGASILINSRVGSGAIVSSNSLVRGDVPAFSICAGVPARVIQQR